MFINQTFIGQLCHGALLATRPSAPIFTNPRPASTTCTPPMGSHLYAELRCSMLHKHYFYSEVHNHTALTSYGVKQFSKKCRDSARNTSRWAFTLCQSMGFCQLVIAISCAEIMRSSNPNCDSNDLKRAMPRSVCGQSCA